MSIRAPAVRRADERRISAAEPKWSTIMRYMYIVSTTTPAAPTPELLEEMGKFAEREAAVGTIVSQGGLLPLEMGARVRLTKGKVSVIDGPFAEAKEVIGGFSIVDFATREEALASAVRFMEMHAKFGSGWEGVCEMRPMIEGSDEL
jgi:hypothetical protein